MPPRERGERGKPVHVIRRWSMQPGIAVSLIAAGAAFAQPMAAPPHGSRDGGLLEGQSVPAPRAGAPGPKAAPPAGRDAARPEMLFTRNAAKAAMWVTIYRDGAIDSAACVASGEGQFWSL